MYVRIWAINLVGGLLLVLPALLAVWSVARDSRQATARRSRRNARLTLGALGVAGVLLVVQGVTDLVFLGYGWAFALPQLVVSFPPLLLTALAVLFLTLPRLWPLALAPNSAEQTDDDDEDAARRRATHPALVVPVYGLPVAALVGIYTTLVPPAPLVAALLLALWASIVAAIGWWQLRLWRVEARAGVAGRARRQGLHRLAVVLSLVLALTSALWLGQRTSVLPARTNMAADMATATMAHSGGVAVPALIGPALDGPVRRFTLTADESALRLASGATVDAWAFNGSLPGPELRAIQGDTVEVTLINQLAVGTTIHWHGVDVPNAMDGVAGVTQDAVPPGGHFVYRFRADQAGTFWYHSHQEANEQVHRGLFGALVVLPRGTVEADDDLTLVAHTWGHTDRGSRFAFGADDLLDRRAIRPGATVRLRLVNTDDDLRHFVLRGTPFRLAAIDGTDLDAPDEVRDLAVAVPAGAKYDLTFTMPDQPVALTVAGAPEAGLLLSVDGGGTPPVPAPLHDLDITRYGHAAAGAIGPGSHFDRQYVLDLSQQPGFYNGHFGLLSTVNGQTFPQSPMLMVREGDLVKLTFHNAGFMDHPMHLHGHHWLVLSRDGQVPTGSPLWLDTINVAPGETWEVAFRADNPGIWMDHCHTLWHAAGGMMLDIGYEGVSTPFDVGDGAGNHPD